MSEHYYSKQPQIESDVRKWNTELAGLSFSFTTDRGVFSKGEVDFGSRFLIEEMIVPSTVGPILDVGCGYGPIGLTLARKNSERDVTMVDVNERALLLSQINAEENGVNNVKVYQSNGFEKVKENNFALIVTNPPIRAGKKVVHDILEQAYEHLKPLGELWVVIQKKQGAPSAIEKLNEVFGQSEVYKKKKGYYLIVAKKID
ncbi:class I SAM-dependent methyltransferase [Alkalihalobacillus pseudalcaliphilus]|uniref:class I SAM-dependent methyltransferase n=1 Tax=Alkalihalobacillus pseudalcaliphilus TaxID=79884 RepID=UPI00064DC981|nr:class I SAM-dependent methyltransferase [Alkalihalobacillus pseudalcaliphilus]KMK74916.1 16S rRNA methyltransferase [Alkalihalobacillus pseudalcaliphilus]